MFPNGHNGLFSIRESCGKPSIQPGDHSASPGTFRLKKPPHAIQNLFARLICPSRAFETIPTLNSHDSDTVTSVGLSQRSMSKPKFKPPLHKANFSKTLLENTHSQSQRKLFPLNRLMPDSRNLNKGVQNFSKATPPPMEPKKPAKQFESSFTKHNASREVNARTGAQHQRTPSQAHKKQASVPKPVPRPVHNRQASALSSAPKPRQNSLLSMETLKEEIIAAVKRIAQPQNKLPFAKVYLNPQQFVAVMQQLHFIQKETEEDIETLRSVWRHLKPIKNELVSAAQLVEFLVSLYSPALPDSLSKKLQSRANPQQSVRNTQNSEEDATTPANSALLKVRSENSLQLPQTGFASLVRRRESLLQRQRDQKRSQNDVLLQNHHNKLVDKANYYMRLGLLTPNPNFAATKADFLELEKKIRDAEVQLKKNERIQNELSGCTFKPEILKRKSNISDDKNLIHLNIILRGTQLGVLSVHASELGRLDDLLRHTAAQYSLNEKHVDVLRAKIIEFFLENK